MSLTIAIAAHLSHMFPITPCWPACFIVSLPYLISISSPLVAATSPCLTPKSQPATRKAFNTFKKQAIDKYDLVEWDAGWVTKVNVTKKNALNQRNRLEYEGWAKRSIQKMKENNPDDS
jgi:hypothetical protein